MRAAALPTVGLSFAAELFLEVRGTRDTDLSFLRGFLLLLAVSDPSAALASLQTSLRAHSLPEVSS